MYEELLRLSYLHLYCIIKILTDLCMWFLGNFTQMIWKSSERLGVGQASDGKGMFITVAFYEPAGNITNPGYFRDNVKPVVK